MYGLRLEMYVTVHPRKLTMTTRDAEIASTATNKAHAYCEEYIKDSTEDFEFTKICASSIGKPFYRIVQHLFDEGSSLTFAFAPRSRKLLCHRYELRDEKIEYCNNYGVDFFPKKFKGKKFNVTMIDIDQSKPNAFKALLRRNLFLSTLTWLRKYL